MLLHKSTRCWGDRHDWSRHHRYAVQAMQGGALDYLLKPFKLKTALP